MTARRLTAEVERVLEEHAFSEVRTEVGGLLVGTLDEGGATISATLPALSAQAGQTHVTFTHEVWQHALTVLDRDHAGQRIVGWYHTHPGFGLFLSEYDRFVHREFFGDPRMLALVVDPVAGERGWFQADGEQLELVAQEPTAQPGRAAAVKEQRAERSTTRVPALLAVPALLLAGAIGGYALAGTTVDDVRPTEAAAASDAVDSPPTEAGAADVAASAEVASLRQQVAQLEAAVPPPAPAGFRYRVRAGDSLSELAQSVYGSAQRWTDIAGANPGIDAERLAVGQVVCVPLPRSGPAVELGKPACP